MSPFEHARSMVLWAIEIALVVIWLTTLWMFAQDGDYQYVLQAVAVVALLVVLYYAEGIELAVADLLDKQPDQLSDPQSADVLKDIQDKRGFFFAQRQLFVVAIIAFMSLMTSYPWLYVPWVGKVDGFNLPFWFSLVFTTLTVLWFCQVTPKRLAVINSERFLEQSRFLWPVIKVVGKLGLPGPSDHIVQFMERWSAYRYQRHLRPSRAIHYDHTAHIFGFSLDRLSVDITVNADGSASIVKRFLVLFLHGSWTRIHGHLSSASAFASRPVVTPLALYTRPVPEQFELIAPELDAIFEGREPRSGDGFSANRIGAWQRALDHDLAVWLGENGEEAGWAIRTEHALPESLWPDAAPPNAPQPPLVALLYQVEAAVAEGAFRIPGEHHWDEYIQFPCRTFSVTLRGAPDAGIEIDVGRCDVGMHNLATPLAEETERCRVRRAADAAGDAVTVSTRYPMQGGIYRIHWTAAERGGRQATDDDGETPALRRAGGHAAE